MGGVGEEEETWRNPFKRFQHSVFTYKYCSKTTNLRVIDSSVLSILSSSLLASVLNFLPYILVLFKVVLSFLSAFQGGGNLWAKEIVIWFIEQSWQKDIRDYECGRPRSAGVVFLLLVFAGFPTDHSSSWWYGTLYFSEQSPYV